MPFRYQNARISFVINTVIFLVFVAASVIIVIEVRTSLRQGALREAEQKANIILARNLATHEYFSHHLKPAVFTISDRVMPKDYFDPAWMSSTFAVREIDTIFRTFGKADYYYKECAINARSPGNEADAHERSFIDRLNREPSLMIESGIRVFDGKPFFTVLRRGEVMEEACLRCHDTPARAPRGLVLQYGPERSFQRKANDVVSAVSIRIPLATAYADADRTAYRLSIILVATLVVLLIIKYSLNRKLVFSPLEKIRSKAIQISSDEKRLGEEIDHFPGRELSELSSAFNRMSKTLRQDRDNLERLVEERTMELKQVNEALRMAIAKMKTLSGLLPICASCKKIRDDEGYWQQIEAYITSHSEAEFSHGLCPDCAERLYPELYRDKGSREE